MWNHDSTIECGPMRLSVHLATVRPEQWQHFALSFGSHSEASHEECLENWPREAIARARKVLDDFETLFKEKKNG